MGDATTIAKQNEEEGSPPQRAADSKNNISDKIDSDTVKTKESADSDAVEIVCDREKIEDLMQDDRKNNLSNEVFYLEVIDKSKAKTDSDMSIESCPTPTPTPRRVNKLRDHSSTIFPAGCMGCREDPPSDHIASPRRFLDHVEAKDHAGHIDNTPRKRPSSAKPSNGRNPLTGAGVTDDLKKPFGRRRVDGNPLLGEGYETKDVTPSCTRIPPGGYSQGLW